MGRTFPRISKLISITIAISLTIFTTDLSSAAVKATHNKAGRVNVNVVNTILSGKGVPSASIGIDGDFYLDKTGLNLYGPKTSGKWNIPASLRGPVGPQGPVGIAGKDGLKATSSSTTGLVGPKGDTGLQGLTGIAGATGPQGATGSTGSSGGGSTGAPGSNGSNGTNGLPGAKGETGTAGSPGSNGSKGDTGTVGPSEIRVLNISGPLGVSPWVIATSSPVESVSLGFGSLQIDKSYQYTIIVTGSASSAFDPCYLGSKIAMSGTGATFSDSLEFGLGKNATSTSTTGYIFNFIHHGTATAGSDVANLTVSVIDAGGCTGRELGGITVTITAKAYIQLIGAIL
jgi:hypothetical protein